MTPAGRLLAVDWGERRIGLALSDESRVLAQPLATLTRRTGKRFPMAQLLAHVAQHGVTVEAALVPLAAAGDETQPAHSARPLRSRRRPVCLALSRTSPSPTMSA